ncbi:hypothetical protein [Neobacillus cucumis]|uniref:hypothetical protein n=1 Tax=Neobacillus cucumis TaxID=1740721 RepID=UPI0019650246|nr:hypothetical protein [Neobacillus cucumis]MBM7656218.1 hypothetical protein [Neobacillus cucumis]
MKAEDIIKSIESMNNGERIRTLELLFDTYFDGRPESFLKELHSIKKLLDRAEKYRDGTALGEANNRLGKLLDDDDEEKILSHITNEELSKRAELPDEVEDEKKRLKKKNNLFIQIEELRKNRYKLSNQDIDLLFALIDRLQWAIADWKVGEVKKHRIEWTGEREGRLIIDNPNDIPKNMTDDEEHDFWETHAMSERLLEESYIEDDSDLPPPRRKKVEFIVTDDISHTGLTEEEYRVLEDYVDPKLNEDDIVEITKKEILEIIESMKQTSGYNSSTDFKRAITNGEVKFYSRARLSMWERYERILENKKNE